MAPLSLFISAGVHFPEGSDRTVVRAFGAKQGPKKIGFDDFLAPRGFLQFRTKSRFSKNHGFLKVGLLTVNIYF
jgi:hypothetical protein